MFTEWRVYKSNYSVSSCGLVRNDKTQRILKPRHNYGGYLKVRILGSEHLVHRMVAQAFLGESSLEVNHKDGNKENNHLKNLEYCTSSENTLHYYRVLLPQRRLKYGI